MGWRISVYVDSEDYVQEKVLHVRRGRSGEPFQVKDYEMSFDVIHKSQVGFYGERAAEWLAKEKGVRVDGKDFRFEGIWFEEYGRVPNDYSSLDFEGCKHLPTRFICSECGKEAVNKPKRCWLTAHNPVCPACALRHAQEEGIELPDTSGGTPIMVSIGW